MDELCKRQRDAETNGSTAEFNINEVWQSSFSAFQRTDYINDFIEKYRTKSDYFELLPNDMIRLNERGRRYCLERR